MNNWIPVSERLPEYRETVLVSTSWGDVEVAARDAIKEDGTDDFWDLFLDDATVMPEQVCAWMPFPKSYSKEQEHD